MNILVLMLGRIGDMILLTPFLDLLKEKFPNSNIDIITSRHNYVVLEDNPIVNSIFIYDKKIFKSLKMVYNLRKNVYDFYIDPKDHFSSEGVIFAKLIKSKFKIGFNKENSNVFDFDISNLEYNSQNSFRNKSNSINQGKIDKNDKSTNLGIHFTQRLMKSLKYFEINLPEIPPKPVLYENTNSSEYVEEFLNSINNFKIKAEKFNIILNLSASNEQKMWETGKWIKFLELFKKQIYESINSNVKFIISFEPRHKEIAEQIQKIHTEVSLFYSKSFKDIISLVKRADMIVSPDTSVVHIASAFNIPILVLHSGIYQTFDWFRPLSDINFTIFAEENHDDVRLIKEENVFEKFNEMLIILQKNKKR